MVDFCWNDVEAPISFLSIYHTLLTWSLDNMNLVGSLSGTNNQASIKRKLIGELFPFFMGATLLEMKNSFLTKPNQEEAHSHICRIWWYRQLCDSTDESLGSRSYNNMSSRCHSVDAGTGGRPRPWLQVGLRASKASRSISGLDYDLRGRNDDTLDTLD